MIHHLTIPQHSGYCLIAVASESLPCPANDITEIEGCGKVSDYYVYEKGDQFPVGLFLLSIGVNPVNVWKGYPKSDKIYFFICKN